MSKPFLRVELKAENGEMLVFERQTFDSNQVKIETSARVIYCPPAEVRSALQAMTMAEAQKVGGN